MTELDRAEVLLVGAGPTGLALAAELAASGTRVRIIDRQPDRVHESRALAIQPRTLEVLARHGLADPLVKAGNPAVRLHLHTRRRVVTPRLFDIGIADTAYPFLLFLSQAETERILMLTLRSPNSPSAPVTLESLQAITDRATGGGVRLHDPVWLTDFQLHNRGATHYQRGRIFLADAAHIHSPVGRAVLRMSDRAFTIATTRNPLVRLARTHLAPRIAPLALRFARLRANAFRTIAQLAIHYRTSPLSTHGPRLPRRDPRAGDRLPDAPITRDGQATTLHTAILHPIHPGTAGPTYRSPHPGAPPDPAGRAHRLPRPRHRPHRRLHLSRPLADRNTPCYSLVTRACVIVDRMSDVPATCCTPSSSPAARAGKPALAERPLITTDQAQALIGLFKALANDSRLRLLHALERGGEVCVTDLAEQVQMRPQAVSNQLQRLTDRGILGCRRDGNRIFYRVADPCVTSLLDLALCLVEENGAL